MATPTNPYTINMWHLLAEHIREEREKLNEILMEPLQMSEDLPKQDLLLKLLRMTTSTNDPEALAAIRRANALLTANNWDWDKLIAGKIKVVADPFNSVTKDNPYADRTSQRQAPPPPPKQPYKPARPAQAPPPPPRPQPAPKPRPMPPRINSTKTNVYAGWCFCCGDAVLAQGGFIFDPHDHTPVARSKWQIVCSLCNQHPNPIIGANAAPRQRPLGNVTPNLNQI